MFSLPDDDEGSESEGQDVSAVERRAGKPEEASKRHTWPVHNHSVPIAETEPDVVNAEEDLTPLPCQFCQESYPASFLEIHQVSLIFCYKNIFNNIITRNSDAR